MPFTMTDAEAEPLRFVLIGDLVELAVELDFLPPERVDRRQLLEQLIPRLLELAQRKGLPFSKYDAEELAELPQDHREALARIMGWPPDVKSMVKAGEKVYRTYRNRGSSQVPLLLPSLLIPLARCALSAN